MGATVGVLALQGAFSEHMEMLRGLGVQCREIRQKRDLDGGLDGLILPGGESSVMGNLLEKTELFTPLRDAITKGLPVFGTCAGLILLAKNIEDSPKTHFGVLDITLRRHGFGRQINSFCENGAFTPTGSPAAEIPMVFIRGPYITGIGEGVQVLAKMHGQIVAVQQGHILGAAFHPEVTTDTTVHEYFLKML